MRLTSAAGLAVALAALATSAAAQDVGGSDSPLYFSEGGSGGASQSDGGSGGPPPATDKMRELIFERSLFLELPLDPDQIRRLRKRLDESQKAQSEGTRDVDPVSRSVTVSLRPGEKPPTVNLATGNATTVTVSDATGQPWPILASVTGNPNAFDVQSAGPQGDTNIMVVTPTTAYGASNLILTLKDHPVPIALKLVSGSDRPDYRLDVKVSARGPNAAYQTAPSESLPETEDTLLTKFLDNTPPDSAERLDVDGPSGSADVEAWMLNGKMYVRTDLSLLSPSYTSRANSVSGTKVYALPHAPVLVVSDQGRMHSVSVSQ